MAKPGQFNFFGMFYDKRWYTFSLYENEVDAGTILRHFSKLYWYCFTHACWQIEASIFFLDSEVLGLGDCDAHFHRIFANILDVDDGLFSFSAVKNDVVAVDFQGCIGCLC